MLKRLSLKDFGIIPAADLHFRPGFNVLSGETGAGKSMILDGLLALMGTRVDAKIIRQQAEEALLRAEFSDGLALERRIRPRHSTIFWQEQRMAQQDVQLLMQERLCLYSQHHHHALLRPEEQRQRLDRYARLDLSALRQAWQQWKQAEQAYQQWQAQQAQWQAQQELWRYQLQELEQLAPQPGEFEALSQEQERLSQDEALLQQGAALQQRLEQLSENGKQVYKQAQHFPELAELCEQAWIHHQEALLSLNKRLYTMQHDPQRLQEVEQRMSALHQLARKHRCPPEDLARFWQNLQQHVQQQQHQDGEALAQALEAAEALYHQEAAQITAQRQHFAPLLAQDMLAIVQELGMNRAQIHVSITPSTASAYGSDQVQFLVSFNQGQALQHLQQVASGGELSRFSLALEVASLGEQPVATMIFDEVDTGIGGEVAHSVGRLLKRLGEKQQVICITHLAQVACYAQHHWAIEKEHREHETISTVRLLHEEERVQELARMLGSAQADKSLQWAASLLNEANQE